MAIADQSLSISRIGKYIKIIIYVYFTFISMYEYLYLWVSMAVNRLRNWMGMKQVKRRKVKD